MQNSQPSGRSTGDIYQFLFEQSSDAIFVVDVETARIIDVNQEVVRRLGYTREELLRLAHYDIVSGEPSSENFLAFAQRVREEGQSVIRRMHRSKKGDLIPAEITVRYLELDDNPVFICVTRDISESTQQWEVLRDHVVRGLLDSLPDQAAILDKNGTIVHVNTAWRDFGENNGATQDYVGPNYLEVCDRVSGAFHEGAAEAAAGLRAVLNGEIDTFEMEYPCHSPAEQRWFLMRITCIEDPQEITAIVTHADVTRHKQYETEHRERLLAKKLQEASNALARTVNLDDALHTILDLVVDVTECRQVMVFLVEENILQAVAARGYADEHLNDAFNYPDIPLLYDVMAEGQPLVIADTTKDDRWTSQLGSLDEVKSWMGVPLIAWDVVIGFMSISSDRVDVYGERDITAVKAFAQQAALAVENARIIGEYEKNLDNLQKAHDRLGQTARLAVAGEIAAGVAHQINNPLTAIAAEAYLLMQQITPDSPLYESVSVIQNATHRAGTVAQQLLSLSHRVDQKMETVDINDTLVRSVSLVRSQLGSHAIQIEESLAPDLPGITGNLKQLEDLWLNLLLNARDGVLERSNAFIRIGSAYEQASQSVVVSVEDNGHGIPEHQIKHLFDPFFTTRGTLRVGLGLTRCHDIVTRHGGRIEVESKEGKQTKFRIFLPVK